MQSITIIIRITWSHKTREASALCRVYMYNLCTNLWYVYSPSDSRRLNLHTTHSGQVPYKKILSEWHCHRPSGVQGNLWFLEMQNMQMLIFTEWEYWSSDFMGSYSHVSIIEQSTTCSEHLLPSLPVLPLDSNHSHNLSLGDSQTRQ